MFLKCPCVNCSNHLEFEDDHAGETVECPHCGMETTLFVAPRTPNPATKGPRWKLKRPMIWIVIGGVLFIGLATYLGFKLKPYIAVLLPAAGTLIGALIGLVIVVLVLIWAILWIIFPVFVYFNLVKMNRLLEQIEFNSRPTRRIETTDEKPGKS